MSEKNEITEAQIKHMVDRFLGWKLPENFNPDGGISFQATYNEYSPYGPSQHEPFGTNLFDAIQVEAMVRYMIEGLSSLGYTRTGLTEALRRKEAELLKEEEAHGRTIDERDAAEESLGQAYAIVTGNSPEWSNFFGYSDALDEIEEVMCNVTKSAPTEAQREEVEWIVNDNAELGVKIGDRFCFLYKGHSLEYHAGRHDDGKPVRWRYVYKREFGECCHPWEAIKRNTGKEEIPKDFPAAYGDITDWKDIPIEGISKPGSDAYQPSRTPKPARRVVQWEYLKAADTCGAPELSRLGAEGWELTCHDATWNLYVFKRPIQGDTT